MEEPTPKGYEWRWSGKRCGRICNTVASVIIHDDVECVKVELNTLNWLDDKGKV